MLDVRILTIQGASRDTRILIWRGSVTDRTGERRSASWRKLINLGGRESEVFQQNKKKREEDENEQENSKKKEKVDSNMAAKMRHIVLPISSLRLTTTYRVKDFKECIKSIVFLLLVNNDAVVVIYWLY